MMRWVPLLLLCLGCARAPVSASETLAHYARALRDGDVEDAYALLSNDYQARVPLEEFRRRLLENPRETAETAAALGRPAEPVEITARAPYGDGEIVELVREADGFHIRGDVTEFYPQHTPREALRSFVRAMRRGRYDVVLRFVPRAEREGVTQESLRRAATGDERDSIAAMLVALDAHQNGHFEIRGDHASLAYGGGRILRLIREQEVWRVESPE
ncbi:MAG: hypothetical protein GXP55_16880 [Deltaproteobacteria bacterium]|nr:hypothetical protein [Deltaproteobacteria bacterium]